MARAKFFTLGIFVNAVCCVFFYIIATGLTAISHRSADVLSCTPLAQGVLIAIPAIWAFRVGRHKRLLAIGLCVGIVVQFGFFWIWYQHWLQKYAG